MSDASWSVGPGNERRAERLQRGVAAAISALLHLLFVLLLLSASEPTVTTPQGAASGGRMKVNFIGEPRPAPPSPRPTPPPSQRRPAASPVQSTLVERADDPVPPADPVRTPGRDRVADTEAEPSPSPAQDPGGSPPTSVQRRPETWTGRPPGMLEQETAPENAGSADSPAIDQGRGRDVASAEPSMEVGGYLVYYDLRSETQLRAWQAQGMKEIAVPLPGTQFRMVCPLEIALKRGSGKCRLLDPYAPDMQAIGEGREVINMIQVYRRGELVWRGPGPYR